jgi:MFS family permease
VTVSAWRHVADSLRAFRQIFSNQALRRLELAWAGSIIGTWSYGVGLTVFAYDDGGTTAVGLVWLLRLVPAAIASPFAGLLADRVSRRRVMLASDLLRAGALALAAVSAWVGFPALAVYVLTAVVALASTAFHPAQAAVLPSLTRTPEELTAVNAVSSAIESVGFFAGAALGGLLLGFGSPALVFAVTAGTFLWSALLIAGIPADRPQRAEEREAAGTLDGVVAGFRTVAATAGLRTVVALTAAQTFVDGVLNVLIVVVALELLEIGDSGVGYLNSAVGVGGLAGGVVALALVGARRMTLPFTVGLVLWGLPIALIAALPVPAAALVLLAVVGVGNTLVDVAGTTLLQRSAPEAILGRVFGVLETLIIVSIALGAALAPALVAVVGVDAALVATGLVLPVAALAGFRSLAGIDARGGQALTRVDTLARVPLFAPLPADTIEALAGQVEARAVEPGTEVVRQGEVGDSFYVVESGELAVTVDGQAHEVLRSGDYFGEIALLRDVPRTATVTATTETVLYALERGRFIAAVTGHAETREAADAVVAARLGATRPAVASI